MGRWSYSNRIEADYLKKITIYEINALGFLHGYKSYKETSFRWKNNYTGIESSVFAAICTMFNNEFMYLKYNLMDSMNNKIKDIEQRFPLIKTPCNRGGERYWFLCSYVRNGRQCGRRVGVLYWKDEEFACRHCHNLTYESRKLSGRFKAGGSLISAPDLDKVGSAVKRFYYNGKITRKYKRYLKMKVKFKFACAAYLNTVIQMVKERKIRKGT